MKKFKHISLFSGIGGFDLAAQWAGWENVAHCEINPFGQKVLKYYWPNSESFEDITKTDFTKYHGSIDIVSGGFPCQPFSLAGKRKGTSDSRHLWPEMLRAIREIKPRWVVGENVFGIVDWDGGMVFDAVHTDLETLGYTVQPYIVPACAKDAPHRRDRVWFVAHCDGARLQTVRPEQQATRFEQHGKLDGTTPDTANEGIESGIDRREKHIKNDGNKILEKFNPNVQIGATPHSHSIGNDTTQRSAPNTREQSDNEQQRNGRGSEANGFSDERVIANTKNIGKRRIRIKKEAARPPKSNKPLGSIRRLPHGGNGQIPNWQNFPTQSPICGGNDGIPPELDGIPFPKWRNESIKAFGNAVVPQVVYEFFKAINAYEKSVT